MDKCSKCGSKNIEPGIIVPQKKFSFRPLKKKNSWIFVDINVDCCLDCGYIELSVNPEEAKKAAE